VSAKRVFAQCPDFSFTLLTLHEEDMMSKRRFYWRFVIWMLTILAMVLLAGCQSATSTEQPAEEEAAAPAEEAVEEEEAAAPAEEAAEEEAVEEEAMEEPEEEMEEEEAPAPSVLNKVFYGDTWTWPYQPDLLAHMTAGRFFVPIQDESKIAIIDPDAPDYGLTFVETEFIQPHHPWIAPGMRWNWINFQSEGVEGGVHDAIAIQDTQTLEIVKYIETGTNDPFHMAFSPTENLLITADLDTEGGRVHLFDTETFEEIAQVETTGLRTRDITISHDGKYAFIGHQGYDPDNGILGAMDVMDIANREIVASFGEGRCRSGKMTNNGELVLYSCDRSDSIIVVDTATLELVKTIETPEGAGPFNISFRSDDRYGYVGLKSLGQLGIIDMETLEIVKTLDSGTDTNSTYSHPTAPIAITTNDGSDTHVTVIDTENNEVLYTIETGGKSTHNGQWSADGRWFLVTNRGGDSVTLLRYNEETGMVEWVDDILVGFGANGVHWAPYFCGVDELTTDNVMDATNAQMADTEGGCA
jgi:DNA-binding beta-propeller fold protein YncE